MVVYLCKFGQYKWTTVWWTDLHACNLELPMDLSNLNSYLSPGFPNVICSSLGFTPLIFWHTSLLKAAFWFAYYVALCLFGYHVLPLKDWISYSRCRAGLGSCHISAYLILLELIFLVSDYQKQKQVKLHNWLCPFYQDAFWKHCCLVAKSCWTLLWPPER